MENPCRGVDVDGAVCGRVDDDYSDCFTPDYPFELFPRLSDEKFWLAGKYMPHVGQ